MNKKAKDTLIFFSFVGPMILGLFIFAYIPILWGFLISLSEARGSMNTMNFVGIRNYISILKNHAFIESLRNILLYGIIVIPVIMIISLALGIMIKNLKNGRGLFKSVFFMPQAVSIVVASLIWKQALFGGLYFSFINSFLGIFGIESIQWTQNIFYVWFPIITVRLWLGTGFYMILYIASLDEIPSELYDAANLDGVSCGFKLFRYITFPLLHNTNIIIIFILLVEIFRAFDEFYLLAGAGAILNVPLIESPMVFLYVTGFGGQNYGLGSAGSFLIALLIIIITSIQFKFIGLGKAVRNQ